MLISATKWDISTTCPGFLGLFCLSVEHCGFKKNISYSDLPHRRSDCTGGCWCCAPQPGGEFPRTRERPRLEMSRRGAKFPARSSGLTIHTFWSCGDTDGKALIIRTFRFFQDSTWTLHRPADAVEEIIRPVVRSLKEAGEIKLGTCETPEILLILKEQKICKQTWEHEKNLEYNMNSFYFSI